MRIRSSWVGVITFAGPHTTAGLDLPRFAGAFASTEREAFAETGVDAFALRRRCRKPVVMAVQGITFTIGIEMLLAADIVVAADDCRFCQMEPKRGLAVFGGAHVRYVERAGWGNAMYHLLRADEFGAARALQLGFVQEVVPAGQQIERAQAIAAEICTLAPLAVQEIKRGALGVPRTRRGSRVRRNSRDARAHGRIKRLRRRTCVVPRKTRAPLRGSLTAYCRILFRRALNQLGDRRRLS